LNNVLNTYVYTSGDMYEPVSQIYLILGIEHS